MELNIYEFDALEKEIEELPSLHKIAFAAACCERLLPNYNTFSRAENWGNPSVLRTALDEVWQILRAQPVDAVEIRRLREACEGEIPDSDELRSGMMSHEAEAQEAAIAICHTLDACLDPTSQCILKVAKCVTNTIDFFLDFMGELYDSSWDEKSTKEQTEEISCHPLALREMAKQSEDLQRLKEVKTLEPDLLEWLRTSSYNGGKSLIDLS